MLIHPEFLLQHLYESVVDFAIMTMDREGLITSWSAGARKIFGYESDEVLGVSNMVTFTREDIDLGQPVLETRDAAHHGRAAGYRWHVRKDGSLFWADGVLTPIFNAEREVEGYLKILRDITDTKVAQDAVKRLASVDILTGLYNRDAFNTRRNELTAAALRHGHKLLLFMIDLDGFRGINDTYGHQTGDLVLEEAGVRIRATSRESDVVARIGGDEFAVLQLNPTSPLLGATLANKILSALTLPFQIGDREVFVTGSVGIAVYPDDAQTPEGLLKSADLALYEAKARGRNCYHYFTEQLDQIAHRRNLDQTELKRLEREKGFWLEYQPIVDERSGRTVAMEALLRFPEPIFSCSSVEYVVELARETGLIYHIGSWVFAQACAQLRLWISTGFTSTKMAINTCAQELLGAEYLPNILKVLDDFDLKPSNVDLELTERDAIDLERTSTTIVQQLSELGFGIVLDDFGTGYSSLSYLRSLPVTGLKLDKSFLKDVPDDANANAITRAILTLAHDLRLSVTAEGVENTMQLNFLKDAGCDSFQGYLFTAPMSSEAASRWLLAEQLTSSDEIATSPAIERSPRHPPTAPQKRLPQH